LEVVGITVNLVVCPRPKKGRGQRDENAGATGEISKKEPLFKPPVHTHPVWELNPGDYSK